MSATRNPMHPEEEVSVDRGAYIPQDQATTQEQVTQVTVPGADSSMQEEMATCPGATRGVPPNTNCIIWKFLGRTPLTHVHQVHIVSRFLGAQEHAKRGMEIRRGLWPNGV